MAQTKQCAECRLPFHIPDSDVSFYERVSPQIAGIRYPVPAPSRCPMCRLQRRLAHRNQIYVYTRPCSWSGKSIFSMYTEDAPFPVISRELWWGDSWDPLDYGRAFDFSRPFFEQFNELRQVFPHAPLSIHHDENSDYCNHAGQLRSCYFIFNTNNNEECLYCETIPNCHHCIDCSRCSNCEWCYNCTECRGCHTLQSSDCCESCSESWFLLNCRSCRNCFGCVNMRQAQYCIFNKQYSRSEYEAFIGQIDPTSFSARQQNEAKASALFLQHPRPHATWRMVEDVSGNFIFESRNVHDSYSIRDGDELRYSYLIYEGAKSCHDLSMFGCGAELLYECLVCGLGAFNMRFCFDCWDGVSDLDYCVFCLSSQDLFGCVGLRKKRFCILNKQYSEAEYRALVPRIIAHMRETEEWGEFFPIALSEVPYNSSLAQRYFPLTEDRALAKGLNWKERKFIDAAAAIDPQQLPDGLPPEDEPIVVNSALSGRPFRITAEEIKRYRVMGIPLPRQTYNERMEARQARLGGVQLHKIRCAKSGRDLRSTFPPGSAPIIWDREEYEKEFGS